MLAWRWILAGGSSDCRWLPARLRVDVLRLLLPSKARPDLRFSRKDSSAGEPLGDSYALGMAGTGGTSSSSSRLDMEFRDASVLGAGRREPLVAMGMLPCDGRGWMEPTEVRTVLKLADEPTERPEL